MSTPEYMYNVRIKYKDGTLSTLTFKNRTSWKIKTAKKHLRDVIAGIESGRFPGAVYAVCTLE
jgi:hypothetical protein